MIDHVPVRIGGRLARAGGDGSAGLRCNSAFAEPGGSVSEDEVGGAGYVAVAVVLISRFGVESIWKSDILIPTLTQLLGREA